VSEPIRYGQFSSEKLAEENSICRQIVTNISLFGVTERQRLFIIYLLSLEIEDAEKMREITACIKEVAGSEIFLSSQNENGVPNGPINV
jgi:hypothetical protein